MGEDPFWNDMWCSDFHIFMCMMEAGPFFWLDLWVLIYKWKIYFQIYFL